ncbi:MAG: LacI family DNA-binding transcriptional regulator [Chloroflexota bacterium]|nr:LacI family DNA-binding transcriptional regulator [Chloroflexota bacterium]
MRDVAERAGVSVTSVSHVINETRPVSIELRERVLEAMRELGYHPNRLARSLRSGKTHTVGIIVPDNANPFFAEIVRGIEDTSFEHGYSLILCNSDADLGKEEYYIGVLTEKQVDGILFMAAGASTDHIQSLLERHVPVVVVDREVPGVTVDTVLADNARGGWLATRHLIEIGHRRIGCISAPVNLTLSAERVDGYRQALQEAGIPIDEALIVPGNFNLGGGYRATQQLLALGEPPTALFSGNDLMAVGAICAACEAGRHVPVDLSVVGFDDIPLALYTNPPLTTIRQPNYNMGVAAATMLLERVRDPELPPRRIMLQIELQIRRSTSPVVPSPTDEP